MDWDLVRNALEGDGGELGLWGTYDLAQLLALRLVARLVSLLLSQLALHLEWLASLRD